jgi:hypothetical protein
MADRTTAVKSSICWIGCGDCGLCDGDCSRGEVAIKLSAECREPTSFKGGHLQSAPAFCRANQGRIHQLDAHGAAVGEREAKVGDPRFEMSSCDSRASVGEAA